MKISVCIIADRLFPRVGETLKSYSGCDEILLGYNGTEAGLEAFEFPDLSNLRVIRQQWQGYGATKNELAAAAANDWILSVDSDEVADEALQEYLVNFSPSDIREVYLLSMQHYLGNVPVRYGSWGRGKTRFERLYNRNHTAWDEADVHERIILRKDSKPVAAKGTIRHYTAESLQEFKEKNERYAQLSARKYYNSGKRATFLKRFVSPVFAFFKQYVLQLGFMDGATGLHIARGNAVYTFRKYQLLHRLQRENISQVR